MKHISSFVIRILTHQWMFFIILTELPNAHSKSQIKEAASKIKPNATLALKDVPDSVTITTSKPLSFKQTLKFFNKATPKKKLRAAVDIGSTATNNDLTDWRCPNITGSRSLECGCDLPHTLRCSGDIYGLSRLAEHLRVTPYSVVLLDVSLRNVTFLSEARIFDKVSLRCLIISSGEIKRVHKSAFLGIEGPLLALGLPENGLNSVPWRSITTLTQLERLDLSNNKIKALGTFDLANLINLEYLDLSSNQLSSISQRAFSNLKKMEVLKMGGNRIGDYVISLNALSQCLNLRDLDLSANNINGPLTSVSLPILRNLATLNLNRNLIKSIQNKALENFSRLSTLSLSRNQIDVLQDHAFFGLSSLKHLDLSYNGIVAISGASLQHLTRLSTLDLTHNFLRALTSDLIAPLPSLEDLRLSGNDISIVARNALDKAHELKSISMQENPLSCDCTIREFAEWLQVASLVSKDLLTITCATPPKMEGAPLIQVPIEMLSCDVDNVENDNSIVIAQLQAIASKNQSSLQIKDISEEIILKEVYFSTEYKLILTWSMGLSKTSYTCDALFIYQEENINEVLIENTPVDCESKLVNGEIIFNVAVPEGSTLEVGENYRFCLVLIREYVPNSEVIAGCSNITHLEISKENILPKPKVLRRLPFADLAKLERSHETEYQRNALSIDFVPNSRNVNSDPRRREMRTDMFSEESRNLLDTFNKSFIPGIGMGVLVTSFFVLTWGALRFFHSLAHSTENDGTGRSGSPTATTCYAASEQMARFTDSGNQTRYFKLQATTSL